MESRKSIILGAALVVVGGASLIFGNGVLATNVLATDNQSEPAIVVPESAVLNSQITAPLSNVGMYSSTAGETYMALTNSDAGIQQTQDEVPTPIIEEVRTTVSADIPEVQEPNPTDGKLSEEEAKQVGINAIAKHYALTQEQINAFDVRVRGGYAIKVPSVVADLLIWSVQLKPINPEDYPKIECYRATFEDEAADQVRVYIIPAYKEGTPLNDEISSDKAEEIAVAALTKKFALTQKTLDRFTVTIKYYEITPEVPDKHAWWVNLYPTNIDEFSEIGCYWAYIDAKTGEPVQLNSAADGKG